MLARILSPGPSLARYDPGDFAGLTIGVNRAAIMQPCDVWACSDAEAIRNYGAAVTGSPLLFTTRFGRDNSLWRWRSEVFESLFPFFPPHALPWTTLTFTAAVVFAASRGALLIDCYGADWQGMKDADGVEAGSDRTPARWRHESGVFAKLSEAMKSRGVEVRRIVDGN